MAQGQAIAALDGAVTRRRRRKQKKRSRRNRGAPILRRLRGARRNLNQKGNHTQDKIAALRARR